MLRRPVTAITLTPDDLHDFDMRAEQKHEQAIAVDNVHSAVTSSTSDGSRQGQLPSNINATSSTSRMQGIDNPDARSRDQRIGVSRDR